ncbi:hypothetical protein [Legionella jordanis]|uniref:Tfp pilus assembly protein PilX n=1 Tax=Legionella jordanis TaxID=456 RepID=A0A0W0VEB2_9GAMM|nr:hypothetical protein [Legionella jordanis]KTD18469.1 hypothetical protein Ljor_2775 [Legionella jordanis]RMX05374.1 hypothetical protein EAW55_01560 [Legionella jordanis]RMX20778.1 hypothetical protein EAS68_05505 [Legionella jordanis]VEH13183.1 Uncharacterised protein [Legionella jordanis]HAT8715041.1 hypothetical protein [Legionella jordanis]
MKERGIILLSTLLMLSLLSLLIISHMGNFFLFYRSLNQYILKKEMFYKLEFQAAKLAKGNWKIGQACVLEEQDPNSMMSKVAAQGCSLGDEGSNYFYLIEQLGFFPCLQSQLSNQAVSTRHFRVNILSKKPFFAFLQLRVSRAIPVVECPSHSIQRIALGILSWRFLDNFS